MNSWEALSRRNLERLERLWLDPEWDAVFGYREPPQEEDDPEEG